MSILSGLKKFENDPKLNLKIEFLILEWQRSYPNIDVRSQIQWAHNWLLENPKKDKKDYVRFLGMWMRGAEKRRLERKTNVVVHKPYIEDKPKVEDVMDASDWAELKKAIRK